VRGRFGALSVCFGAAGLLAAIGVTEAERVRRPGFGHLLIWMDRLGWVRAPKPGQMPEWWSSGLLDLTDDRVLQWTLVYSICFAIWAILMALLAEHYREESSSLIGINCPGGIGTVQFTCPPTTTRPSENDKCFANTRVMVAFLLAQVTAQLH
jgi:hypothetical protein